MMRIMLMVIVLLSSRIAFAQNSIEVMKDTVKIADVEFVVRNATKDTTGYLYNTGNGTTIFRKIAKAMQFSVGFTNFPAAGDSLYANPDFKNRNIKVWRNGLLQNGAGVTIDTAGGKIKFTPVLIQNEKIYIEIFNSNDFSSLYYKEEYMWITTITLV